ncbi:methanethiol S-methyltransferase [Cryptosporangium minutisporangium]|uniref:methanethiol S-methyltransferase n=1 Tax=Cryptosporangium minutisporangium TaxID=113569 RepID=A0ABP6TC74_9ACTN
MLRRVLVAGYGAVAYVFFLVTFLYTIGFLARVAVPKDVDDGPTGPVWLALLVDTALLTLFAVQHSVMARPWFKRWWTRWVAPSIERSTYVLAASLAVAALLWLWRPLPATVWSVPDGWLRWVVWAGQLLGWGLVLLSTFQIGHFDLFGLRQVFARFRSRQYAEPRFAQPLLYRLVRHPLMVGFLIAFWVTPDMSVGRLYFAVVASAYIVVAVRFEEHDLARQLGDDYRRYQREVPRFVPRVPGTAGRRRAVPVEPR